METSRCTDLGSSRNISNVCRITLNQDTAGETTVFNKLCLVEIYKIGRKQKKASLQYQQLTISICHKCIDWSERKWIHLTPARDALVGVTGVCKSTVGSAALCLQAISYDMHGQ